MHTLYTLNGSWEAYNERKIQMGQDPGCYSPEELWEFDYLVNMIQADRPSLNQLTILLAVREGMRRIIAPRPRLHFVEWVMNNIKERESQWSNLLESMGEGVRLVNTSTVQIQTTPERLYRNYPQG